MKKLTLIDFTLNIYENLLKALLKDSAFITFDEFIQQPPNHKSFSILRHDVDLLPQQSFLSAKLEHSLNIRGTYYFRIIPRSFDENIIRRIADLGHEIGYHYEDLTLAKGNIDKAIKSFEKNLNKLRKIAPVSTACMHGSPQSPWDSKDLWKKYDYRDFGITGEPYFDINFAEVFYLTDTGRRWDGWKVSVRDKVPEQERWKRNGWTFHSTQEIIKAACEKKLPDKMMITIHPQRWHEAYSPWLKELMFQRAKNLIKRWYFVKS